MNSPDLTQRPARSARVKVGGCVILPRVLDVGRAHLAGKAGEYRLRELWRATLNLRYNRL
jgi:hypothetical protein